MLTPRRALTIGLSGVAALALVAYVSQVGRPPAGAPAVAAAVAAQDAQFSLDPDTLVGWGRGPVQPIFFSHRRHAGEYEIECLYCHSNTDIAPWASMPPVELCLGCHQVVKRQSSEIAKLLGYEERAEPIPWERIYKVADFVQFHHGRHVLAEVECQECHGEVEEHDVLWQWSPLTMGWCLECHRQPEPHLRPQEFLTAMDWVPPEDPLTLGRRLRAGHNIDPSTDCSTCHR